MERTMPKILKEQGGAHEERGEHARMSAFIGAIAVADLVKTTLGPKGMDKILQSVGERNKKKISFTNDGATILKSIPIDNGAAKIIVDISKTQDAEVGDGTTSVAVLCGEFLREAEKLINMQIHPQTIMRGWRKAVVVARTALASASKDHSSQPEQFREDLINIAQTTLSSKILATNKLQFSEIAVSAVLRLKGSSDLNNIHVIKVVGGSLADSYLDTGFILEKSIGVGQPKRMENVSVLVANTAMDTDKIKIHGAKVKVNSISQLAKIEQAEKEKMKAKVKKIMSHGIECFIDRQLIYNFAEQMFSDAGIMAIEHADFEGVERLALALGAEIASTFDHPELVKLGRCKLIEEIIIGENKMIRFSGVAKGEACTVVLRGASKHILDEAERSLHDALCILINTVKNKRVVFGGGSAEMLMAKEVDLLMQQTHGKEQLAIEAFSRALRALPTILAENAGFDAINIVSQLRAAHYSGKSDYGIDMDLGQIASMEKLRITESFKSKIQMLISAHEGAEMILRVDEIIKCAPRQRTR